MGIYLDNAATSYPKPEAVYAAMDRFARHVGASAGRGAYREAYETAELLEAARRDVARLFNAPDPARVIFGHNCTDALNLAIKGLLRPGDHAITTWMDHNSVLRPMRAMEQRGAIAVTRVRADGEGFVDPADIRRALRPNTRLIVVVHASNVTGSVQDAAAIQRIAREAGVPMLLDAAQTAGHLPIDMQADGHDLVAIPGHKGLLGPLGTGALIVRPGIELHTLREGGTGSRSEDDVQPASWPDRHEAGSHNALGLVGLGEGVRWILREGFAAIRARDEASIRAFLAAIEQIDGVTRHGPRDPARRVGVFSVTVGDRPCLEVGEMLDRELGIKVRAGLHCAPLAHRTIGTLARGGTVRFSFGHFNTPADACAAAEALEKIAHPALR